MKNKGIKTGKSGCVPKPHETLRFPPLISLTSTSHLSSLISYLYSTQILRYWTLLPCPWR